MGLLWAIGMACIMGFLCLTFFWLGMLYGAVLFQVMSVRDYTQIATILLVFWGGIYGIWKLG